MQYSHTQRSPLYLMLIAIAGVMAVSALMAADEPIALYSLTAAAVIMFVLGLSFGHLRVEDDRQSLLVCFGPLPLFWTRVAYDDITEVTRAKSSWIDGWGIHYIPGRGWTWNLWGYDCVELQLGGRIFRIGSNDADNLFEFLSNKVNAKAGAAGE